MQLCLCICCSTIILKQSRQNQPSRYYWCSSVMSASTVSFDCKVRIVSFPLSRTIINPYFYCNRLNGMYSHTAYTHNLVSKPALTSIELIYGSNWIISVITHHALSGCRWWLYDPVLNLWHQILQMQCDVIVKTWTAAFIKPHWTLPLSVSFLFPPFHQITHWNSQLAAHFLFFSCLLQVSLLFCPSGVCLEEKSGC